MAEQPYSDLLARHWLEDQKLTPHQKDAYETLKWYYFGEHASGRTRLEVVVAIVHAMENPGKWIYIQDHYPTIRATEQLYELILGTVMHDRHLKQHKWEFQIRAKGFRFLEIVVELHDPFGRGINVNPTP